MFTTKRWPARRWLAMALLAASVTVLGALGACCTLGLKNCTPLDSLNFVGDQKLNSCSAGKDSAPVWVRVYYLKDSAGFLAARLEDLVEDSKEELGDSMLGSPAILKVVPGKSIPWESPRPSGANYIGIAANFCNDDGTWREVIPLTESVRSEVTLTGITLSVAHGK
jgi:type VI secretion system VasD/TssJ family lipoprotein